MYFTNHLSFAETTRRCQALANAVSFVIFNIQAIPLFSALFPECNQPVAYLLRYVMAIPWADARSPQVGGAKSFCIEALLLAGQ